MNILQTIYNNAPNLLEEVQTLVQQGANIRKLTSSGESPLRVASRNGRFEVVRYLLDQGAPAKQLQWTPSFFEVAFGTVDTLVESVETHADLWEWDASERTPFLLSLQVGDLNKVLKLVELGEAVRDMKHMGKTLFEYVIQNNHLHLLKWLIEECYNVNAANYIGVTPLQFACELGRAEAVQLLIAAGAYLFKLDRLGELPIQKALDPKVIQLFLEQGFTINDLSEEGRENWLGIGQTTSISCSLSDFKKHPCQQFGRYHAEITNFPFWQAMIKASAPAYLAEGAYGHHNSRHRLSSYPIWCYKRFGRTSTTVQDGRIIEIGGEHEDYYDEDFCIYNDVVVFPKRGETPTIYSYPKTIFPPTDFHTATLVGTYLYIIGRLGYQGTRIVGDTPVYRLDITGYTMEKVKTVGDYPGWIFKHKACYDEATHSIRITEGIIIQENEEQKNEATYRLSLKDFNWKCYSY